MRFCFAVAPLRGHVNPTLGVASELVRRGHQVDYHVPDSYRPVVEPTGARVHVYSVTPEKPVADPVTRFAQMPLAATRDALEALPQILPALRARPPDVVVYDALCVWGRLAADALAVPSVMLCTSYAHCDSWSMYTSPEFAGVRPAEDSLAEYHQAMALLARTCGTPALALHELLLHQERRTVVFMPRSFHPHQAAFDDRWSFVGPVPVAADHASGHLDRPAPRTVYISLGTLFDDWAGLLPLCESAFADGGWQVIVSSARVPEGRHGPVEVRHDVPQLRTLADSDVFVTHGGMNSTMEAVLTQTPMVVLPRVPEQRLTADRVSELRLGLALDPQTVTPARLRVAVDSVRSNGRILEALVRMRTDAVAAGGPRCAAEAIESASGRTP